MAQPKPQDQAYNSKAAVETLRQMITYYEGTRLYDDDLWESSKERLQDFIDEGTIQLKDKNLRDVLFDLRVLLRQRGVNIRKRIGLTLQKTFEDWLLEEGYGQ